MVNLLLNRYRSVALVYYLILGNLVGWSLLWPTYFFRCITLFCLFSNTAIGACSFDER